MEDFKIIIANKISNAVNLNEEEIYGYIEVPPNKEMGDYAFPCFKLARELKKAPNIIAEELKEKISEDDVVSKVEIAGGYLNFFINPEVIVKEVLNNINQMQYRYGSSDEGNGKNVVIDYSSPNIAKPFHIGHLRTTIIGQALYNIYEYMGYNSIGVNHLGDYGTQFGKLIEGYKRWGTEYDIENNPIDNLMKIYVRINELCKEDETVLEACRENFRLLEQGDEYCHNLWVKFRDVSLQEFQKIYDLLNVKFDHITGESFYTDKMADAVKVLDDQHLIVESEGARVIDLDGDGKNVFIVEKTNGSSIYGTRDLATIRYRASEFDFDKALYVVAYEQAQYFKQLFRVAQFLDIPEKCKKGLYHVQYGMTRLTTGKMSTREGTVVKVEDLLNESIKRVLDVINEKDPEMENKELEAKRIGIGAVIFNNLATTIIKDQVFDWDTALNFNGETGPYIQYVYVRTKSVLEKAGYVPEYKEDYAKNLLDKASINVITTLYNFKDTLNTVIEKNDPSFLARYLITLGQAYSNFYNENKIICDDKELQDARIYLTKCVGTVLKQGSKLLGIEMPDRM